MTDEDAYYIGNLILNGMGDGQSPQLLSILPLSRRRAASRARMQIRRVEVVRNFVAQQIHALPAIDENTDAGRAVQQLQAIENQHEPLQQQQQAQRRSQSEQRLRASEEEGQEGSRRGTGIGGSGRVASIARFRGRSRLRVRARSLSPGIPVLQITASPQRLVVDERNDENLRLSKYKP